MLGHVLLHAHNAFQSFAQRIVSAIEWRRFQRKVAAQRRQARKSHARLREIDAAQRQRVNDALRGAV